MLTSYGSCLCTKTNVMPICCLRLALIFFMFKDEHVSHTGCFKLLPSDVHSLIVEFDVLLKLKKRFHILPHQLRHLHTQYKSLWQMFSFDSCSFLLDYFGKKKKKKKKNTRVVISEVNAASSEDNQLMILYIQTSFILSSVMLFIQML